MNRGFGPGGTSANPQGSGGIAAVPGKAGEVSAAVNVATLWILGRSPFAPGTVGTAFGGIPAAWLCSYLHWSLQLAVLVVVCIVGCRVSTIAEEELGRKDPGSVVIDELAGYLVTMIWLPVTAKSLFLGFLAFRLFDIWKPWPVNVLDERVQKGTGIMADDLGAGIYAHALVWILLQLWA
ncbi:MAG: phosphatidylglycerophosphatase A [Syntrophobacteraceae bacterium]|nr:phosphatidylglycerophosphatase A [Desulfobacteraceae bacterium]